MSEKMMLIKFTISGESWEVKYTENRGREDTVKIRNTDIKRVCTGIIILR